MDTMETDKLVHRDCEVCIPHVVFPPLSDQPWLTHVVDMLFSKILDINGSTSPLVKEPIWANISNHSHIHPHAARNCGANLARPFQKCHTRTTVENCRVTLAGVHISSFPILVQSVP